MEQHGTGGVVTTYSPQKKEDGKTYDVVYLNHKETICYEVIDRNKPRGIAYAIKARKKSSGNYQNGIVKVVLNGTWK
jgi:hypothetical protein